LEGQTQHGKIEVPLHHPNGTIVVICAILEQTMSMKTGDSVIQLVVDGKDKPVAQVQVNCGRRPPAIDPDDRSLVGAIRIGGGVRDIPLQRANCGEHGPREKTENEGGRPSKC